MTSDLTNYYYAFSTIAQALAASLALSTIFILSYMDYFKKSILFHAKEITSSIPIQAITRNDITKNIQKINSKNTLGEINGIVEIINELLEIGNKNQDLLNNIELINHKLFIEDKLEQRNWVKTRFKISLTLGFIAILLSMIIIPLVPYCPKILLFLMIVFLLLFSSISMFYLFKIISHSIFSI